MISIFAYSIETNYMLHQANGRAARGRRGRGATRQKERPTAAPTNANADDSGANEPVDNTTREADNANAAQTGAIPRRRRNNGPRQNDRVRVSR